MAQFARSTLVIDDVPNHDIRVMQWPANVCAECAHPDCERRRRSLRVPCTVCGKRIQLGQRYRVLSKVDGEVDTQVHADCEIEVAAQHG